MEIDGPPPELETFREAPECNLGLAAPDQLDLRPDCGPLQMLVVWSHFVAFIGCIDLFLPFPWQRHILAGLMFVQVSYVGSVPHVESRVWSCFYNSCSTITIRHTSAVYSIYIYLERERERERRRIFHTDPFCHHVARRTVSSPSSFFHRGPLYPWPHKSPIELGVGDSASGQPERPTVQAFKTHQKTPPRCVHKRHHQEARSPSHSGEWRKPCVVMARTR